MRMIGGLIMFGLGLGASLILMLVRRGRGGGVHMARAVGGVILLLWVPFILAGVPGTSAIPNSVTVPPVPYPWAHPAEHSNQPDWVAAMDDVLGRVTPLNAGRAGAVFVGALLLVFWPARSRRPDGDKEQGNAPVVTDVPTISR